MIVLIAFIGLFSLLFFVIGIFSPRISLFWLGQERTRTKSAIIYFAIFVVANILYPASNKKVNASTANNPPTNKTQQAEQPKKTEQVAKIEKVSQNEQVEKVAQPNPEPTKKTKGFWDYDKFPKCDSINSKATLTGAFNQSQYARENNLSLVDMSDLKEIGDTDDKKTCSATILLNNTQSMNVAFNWKMNSDNSAYLLTLQEQR